MKIVSWNVNGIRASYKKGALPRIFMEQPDIVAIQETKSTPDQLVEAITTIAGYTAYFDSATERKGYSGVAVYTKEIPEKVVYGLGVEGMDHEGRLLQLHFKDFIFVTCYFPNGGRDEEHFQFKLRYYEEFLKLMKQLEKKKPVIFSGDLNVAHNEIDLARPKENSTQIGFLPVERAWVDKVVASGFVDTYRESHGDTVKYSWWDQKTRSRERNVGWRIDYIFVSASLKEGIQHADILTEIEGSDHAPVVLDIAL
ncbi:MAG: Exodeoxyribonuclease exodeoxyribonuclease [Candidatus Parcubacteria bacterium]|jgi:exodeoxyribonuclease III